MRYIALALLLAGCASQPLGVCETMFLQYPEGQHMSGHVEMDFPVYKGDLMFESVDLGVVYCFAWAYEGQQ